MDIYKKMTVWDLLNFLKSQVKNNVDLINSNITEIKTIQAASDELIQTQQEVERLNELVTKLTTENNQLLHLFNELLKAHNVYHTVLNPSGIAQNQKPPLRLSNDFINNSIEKTISGELPINIDHPLLSDTNATESLLQRCLQEEFYEKCAEIVKIKENKLV